MIALPAERIFRRSATKRPWRKGIGARRRHLLVRDAMLRFDGASPQIARGVHMYTAPASLQAEDACLVCPLPVLLAAATVL